MKKVYKHLVENIKTIMFTIVMLILIASFGMWGIGDVVKSILYSSNSVAEINGQKISNRTIDNNFRKQLHLAGNAYNTSISIEDGVRAGLLGQSTKKFVTEIALNLESNAIGIEVNEDLIAKQIKSDSFFQNDAGEFDPEKFKRVIEFSGYANEKQFIEDLKKERARLDLLQIVMSGVTSSEVTNKLMDRYDSEIRSAKYIILPFDKSSVDTSEEKLKEYFELNKNKYRTPITYNVSILEISKNNPNFKDLSDEEIEEEMLSQVDMADNLLAEEFSLEEIGEEIDIKIKTVEGINPNDYSEDSLDPQILGLVNEMSQTSQYETSPLKETSDGNFFSIRIDAKKGDEPKSFEDVKDEIKNQYIEETAEENRRKESVNLVKAINAGEKTLDEIAKELNVEVTNSQMFHRLPEIEELKVLSPIAIAQLFTKEQPGDAGLSILSDGVFIFVLDKIEQETNVSESTAQRRDREKTRRKSEDNYLMMEAFANSLLEKYNAEINYNALDKMYDIEQD